MKSVKLKPLSLAKNEVFVSPPDFIKKIYEAKQQEKLKNSIVASISEIQPHLQQRKVTKAAKEQKFTENDEEAVKNLSEWKRSNSPTSPLLRKYTFRRQGTLNLFGCDSPVKIRTGNHAVTAVPSQKSKLNLLVSKVQGIVALERFKKKTVDEQFKKVSKYNLEIEDSIKRRIIKITGEVHELKEYIKNTCEELADIQNEIKKLQKSHEERLRMMKQQEIEDLLFRDKAKNKKLSKQGEEGQYLINKERMRQLKHDSHKKFQEDLESLNHEKQKAEKILEITIHDRQKSKKELKGLSEDICTLYLRILKEGKDLRTDGLRWIIKAIWKLGESIPLAAFPKFLDEDSIHYLLLISEKDLEFEYFQAKIEKVRKEIKSQRCTSSISSSRELYRSVKQRLSEISRSVVSQPINGRCSADIYRDSGIEAKDPRNYSELAIYRGNIAQIAEKTKEITDTEIKRITEAYELNPGEADKIGLFHLIKCLVGDKVREFNKYTRRKHKSKQNSLGGIA